MRRIPLLLMLALDGCTSAKNAFQVQDPRDLVRSAALWLCGSETAMVREGSALTLTRSTSQTLAKPPDFLGSVDGGRWPLQSRPCGPGSSSRLASVRGDCLDRVRRRHLHCVQAEQGQAGVPGGSEWRALRGQMGVRALGEQLSARCGYRQRRDGRPQ